MASYKYSQEQGAFENGIPATDYVFDVRELGF
jgi:hypothetical protein